MSKVRSSTLPSCRQFYSILLSLDCLPVLVLCVSLAALPRNSFSKAKSNRKDPTDQPVHVCFSDQLTPGVSALLMSRCSQGRYRRRRRSQHDGPISPLHCVLSFLVVVCCGRYGRLRLGAHPCSIGWLLFVAAPVEDPFARVCVRAQIADKGCHHRG